MIVEISFLGRCCAGGMGGGGGGAIISRVSLRECSVSPNRALGSENNERGMKVFNTSYMETL